MQGKRKYNLHWKIILLNIVQWEVMRHKTQKTEVVRALLETRVSFMHNNTTDKC